MSIFITGSTGYIGSYVVANLLRGHGDRLALLVRAKHGTEARERLWRALQLHMGFEEFESRLSERIDIHLGDITEPQLGLSAASYERLVAKTESIIHIAASLNRRSAKVCMNVNLRGSLEVLKLARAAQSAHGLRRFSDVSTVAVAGERASEIVYEDTAIDWQRSDYDPYARTKKFAEHMLHELLPDVPTTVFRPSIVLGDSERAATTQFDMVRAFAMLARLPILPFRPEWRLDIVPADYVARAIVTLHQQAQVPYPIYHLSSGRDSLRCDQIVRGLQLHGRKMHHVFAPQLNRSFNRLVNAAASAPRGFALARPASLLKVFMPYLCFDTVFDNTRVTGALGERPTPFDQYASRLLDYAIDHQMSFPYEPYPERTLEVTEPIYA
ncbi:MAG TPA: SDR family oxidoreductase [Polyangiales bacterium]|nr:SDR family oxidoreductase [Polyangiales bacterium]